MIKIIEADGWYLVKSEGSHRKFHHPTKAGAVTIAGKPSLVLVPKTARSIFVQAQLEEKS
jgi:predicted RNA binding protein YcfA (HicA-like mRNA interferase family)